MSGISNAPPPTGMKIRLRSLFVTHFGPSSEVGPHLASVEQNVRTMSDLVRQSLEQPGEDADRARAFGDYVRAQLAAHLTPEDIAPHEVGAPYEVSWWGLARYWRTRATRD